MSKSHREFKPFQTAKSNCTNTLTKFYDPVLETVESLDLYTETEPSSSVKKRINKTFFHQTNNLSLGLGLDTLSTYDGNYSQLNEILPQLIQNQQKEKNVLDNPQVQKVENVAMEARLNHKKKYLEDRIAKKKLEKKETVHEIVNLSSEIENLHVEIQYLVNYVKYADQEEKDRINMTSLNRKGGRHNSNDDEVFTVMSILQKEARKREEDAKMKEKEIELKRMTREKKKEKVNKLNAEIDRMRTEYKSVRSSLISHYHNLLRQGRDTRSEGLVWIIKEILLLGTTVKLSHLPTFLDETCIAYLFQYAHIDIELHKISEEKTVLKQSVKNKKIDINLRKQLKLTFKTSLDANEGQIGQVTQIINNVDTESTDTKRHIPNAPAQIPRVPPIDICNSPRTREFSLKKLDSTLTKYKDKEDIVQKYKEDNVFDSDTEINMKTIGDFLNKKILLDKETIELIDSINILEKKENELKEVLETMKKMEMNRLFKEFVRNDYERRFNVNKRVVISAMIGEDNTTHEVSRQQREQKNYYDKLKTCRMFNPSELSALKNPSMDRIDKKMIFKSLLI